MPDPLPDLTDSERLALQAVAYFDEKVAELRLASAALGEAVEGVHAATKDLAVLMREAHDAVKRLSRDEVRKYLAKESERIAAELRRQIKDDRHP